MSDRRTAMADYLACEPNFRARLDAMIDRGADAAACWTWTGSKSSKGYGYFTALGFKTVLAHRLVWGLANSRSPGEMFVRHKCDNPSCCNPSHLEIGTPADNTRDMMERGRHRSRAIKGEASPTAKLMDAQIAEIRSRRAVGERLGPLSQEFGISLGYIDKIVSGRVRIAPVSAHGERR